MRLTDFRGIALPESSVGSGMFGIERIATTVFEMPIPMPLLTELVSAEDGFCYRHAAPNGAVPASLHPIPP